MFLEDIARRGLGRFVGVVDDGKLTALCHVGANLVPSGRGVAALAKAAARGEPRMMVGEEGAVTELWEAIGRKLPRPLDDRPGQPVYVLDDAACRRTAPAYGGRRWTISSFSSPRAPPRTSKRSASTPTPATRSSSAGARGARSSSVAAGSGSRTAGSASRRRRRRGPRRRSSSSRSGSSRSCGAAGMRRRRSATCARCSSRTSPPSACSRAPTTSRRLRLYDSIGMRRTITYRSLIFT